jgi:hypothetical protein
MNIKIPSSSQIPLINTSDIHNRKAIKSENLHRAHQEKIADYNRVRLQDYELNRTDLQDWEVTKSIEDINRYMSIKRSVEYGLYQYSKHLGSHVDVYV